MQDSIVDRLVATRNAADLTVAEIFDQADDRSSSLSDPDDDQEEDQYPMNGLAKLPGDSKKPATNLPAEVDSEAETERLEQTPQKMRSNADNLGKTPSKLGHATAIDDELSDLPSPSAVDPGATSSTSTVATTGKSLKSAYVEPLNFSDQILTHELAAGLKRKRSESIESSLTSAASDLGESPQKRSHDSPTADIEDNKIPDERADIAEENEREDPEAVEEVEAAQEVQPRAKGTKGRKGKPRGKPKKEVIKGIETEQPLPVDSPGEEKSEEAVAKAAEEAKQKAAAAADYESLAKQFATFRERLNRQRLAEVEAELEMLQDPRSKHPEYLRQVACIDARLLKQKTEIDAWFKYKKQALVRTTLAERSQCFSQYFQTVREQREDVMSKLGDDWYDIQKERRQGDDMDTRHIYKLQTKKSEQLRQQAKYNQEVSVLSGVAKYVGFPAAPDISGVEDDAVEEDLKAMQVSDIANEARQRFTH